MNMKNITNLVLLQLRQFSLKDYMTPVLLQVVIILWSCLMDRSFDYTTENVSIISLVVTFIAPVILTFKRFFRYGKGRANIMLPASNIEKFVSIHWVMFIQIVVWFAAAMLGLAALCTVGYVSYDMSVTEEITLYFSHYELWMVLFALFGASGTSLWILSAQISDFNSYVIRGFALFTLVLPIVIHNMSDIYNFKNEEMVMCVFLAAFIVIYTYLNYKTFKKTQTK